MIVSVSRPIYVNVAHLFVRCVFSPLGFDVACCYIGDCAG
jgi:hypothetical protein